MAFIDEVQLHIKAGDGGKGIVSWRHEKFKPKAGPGGGDGGRGGDVFVEAVADLGYLDYYKHTKKFEAQGGQAGGSSGKEGADGASLTLFFPRGTVLKKEGSDEELELTEVGQRVLFLKGGAGGFGNEHFKSSTNTTPYEWTPGKEGEEADVIVELRLFADLGFVGLPSAGKSTLLNLLTNAQSKVGAYHFTTLDPHLGAFHGYILADIPGIIEGASEGKGLGYKFLRHIKRTKALVHLVSLESDTPLADYDVIRKELAAYDADLVAKDEIILLTKTDLLTEEAFLAIKETVIQRCGHQQVFGLSAYDQESIDAFAQNLLGILQEKRPNTF